jgi:tetratricopeptide (TPR) repeat protein
MKIKIHLAVLAIFAMPMYYKSQSINVQNMINYTRNKDFEKARSAADAAIAHAETKGKAKTWKCRGEVFKAIYADTSSRIRALDSKSEEKALEAFTQCFILDKELIYKDEVKNWLVQAASACLRKSESYYVPNSMYTEALAIYNLLENALPYDFDQAMKRSNITKEKLVYNRFKVNTYAGDKNQMKQIAETLMRMGYKEAFIYESMLKLYLAEKDTASALSVIEKGKDLFESNMALIGTEIDIYLARKKTQDLIVKVQNAIELAPDNDILKLVLGQVYEKSAKLVEAEKYYLEAYNLNPASELINYKLGALYFNSGADAQRILNDLKPTEKEKIKKYEDLVKTQFTKAIPFLKKAFELNSDKAYKQRIYQAYIRIGDTENAIKFK